MFNPLCTRACTLAITIGLALGSQTAAANRGIEQGKKRFNQTQTLVAQPNTDQLIIRFRDNASTASVDKVLTRMRSERRENFKYTKSTPDNADVFRFSRSKGKADWDKLSSWLKTNPDVEYVEPDYVLTRMDVPAPVTPNDPYLFRQWSLQDPTGGINAEQAWGYTTGSGSVVAVVDTGVLPHVDLKPNLLPGFDMVNDTFVANDGDGRDADATDPGDYVSAGECGYTSDVSSSWHGTHVSGTIAAVGDNDEGVAGVAYGSKILPVRALGKCGGYTSDVAAGIIWAAGGSVRGVPANPNPARVINMSLGGESACGRTLQNAINTARSKNAVVVVAAGNSNTDSRQFSPANCSGVISVAATGKDGGKAFYSNYGPGVDLAAPGGSVNNADNLEGGILSTLNKGSTQATVDTYDYYQGTSMATPHVSGVAALMLSANPDLTPDQVESVLKSSARTFPANCSGCGAGLLDATAAVEAAIALKPSDPQPPTTPEDPNNPPTGGDSYADLKTALDTNQALWASQKVRNYIYTLEEKDGTDTRHLQIGVWRGRVYAAIDLDTNRRLRSRDLKQVKTIDQLFPIIGNAIQQQAETIQAEYDSSFGYPVSTSIDPSSSVEGDEHTLSISDFQKF